MEKQGKYLGYFTCLEPAFLDSLNSQLHLKYCLVCMYFRHTSNQYQNIRLFERRQPHTKGKSSEL